MKRKYFLLKHRWRNYCNIATNWKSQKLTKEVAEWKRIRATKSADSRIILIDSNRREYEVTEKYDELEILASDNVLNN